jgi:group I intron endonuclease
MGKRIIRSGAYQIVNETNGKSYVGSSKDIINRWSAWRAYFRTTRKNRCVLWDAVQKHGIECFTFIILEQCEPIKEVLLALEQRYIDTLKPEYNILKIAGSRLGSRQTPETIAKMKGRTPPNKGVPHTPEAIERMRIAQQLHWGDEAERIKMSEILKARYEDQDYREKFCIIQQHRWEDQSRRDEMSETKLKWHDEHPDAAIQHSEDLMEYWSDVANRDAQSERKLKFHANNPNAGTEQGERMRMHYEQHPEKCGEMQQIKLKQHEDNPQMAEEARARAIKQFSNPAARQAASEKQIAFLNSPEQVLKREHRDADIKIRLLNEKTVREIVAEMGTSGQIVTAVRKALVSEGLLPKGNKRSEKTRARMRKPKPIKQMRVEMVDPLLF